MTKPKPVGGFCSTGPTAARAPGLCYITTGAWMFECDDVMGRAGSGRGVLTGGPSQHQVTDALPLPMPLLVVVVVMIKTRGGPSSGLVDGLMCRVGCDDYDCATASVGGQQTKDTRGEVRDRRRGPPNGRARLAACIRPACCTTSRRSGSGLMVQSSSHSRHPARPCQSVGRPGTATRSA